MNCRSTPRELIPQPSVDVISQCLGDEMVLVNLRTDQMYQMNRTGARIWELCAEDLASDQIVDALLSEADADEKRVASDVSSLLASLCREGLLDVNPSD